MENLGQFCNVLYANNRALLHFPRGECVHLIVQGFGGFACSLHSLLFIVLISSCFRMANYLAAVGCCDFSFAILERQEGFRFHWPGWMAIPGTASSGYNSLCFKRLCVV